MFPYPLVVKFGNGKSPSSNYFPITAPTPIQKGFRIAMFDYGMVNVCFLCVVSQLSAIPISISCKQKSQSFPAQSLDS